MYAVTVGPAAALVINYSSCNHNMYFLIHWTDTSEHTLWTKLEVDGNDVVTPCRSSSNPRRLVDWESSGIFGKVYLPLQRR